MRLYSAKVGSLATEVVRSLVTAKDIGHFAGIEVPARAGRRLASAAQAARIEVERALEAVCVEKLDDAAVVDHAVVKAEGHGEALAAGEFGDFDTLRFVAHEMRGY